MASRLTAATTPTLLPAGLTAFLRRRLIELSGVALMMFAGFLALALLSFDAADPSLNTAAGQAAGNLAGTLGAYIADLMRQTIGVAALVPIAAPLAWGWSLLVHRRLTRPWLRVALLVPALAAGVIAAAALPAPEGGSAVAGMGGIAGATLLGAVSPHAAMIGVDAWLVGVLWRRDDPRPHDPRAGPQRRRMAGHGPRRLVARRPARPRRA